MAMTFALKWTRLNLETSVEVHKTLKTMAKQYMSFTIRREMVGMLKSQMLTALPSTSRQKNEVMD